MTAAEERRLRRQHRILANSDQRMKLVMGEATGGSDGGRRITDDRNSPDEEAVRDGDLVVKPQDKDGELEEIAKQLKELRKKDLSGTFRGEGGSASFGGGGGRGAGGGGGGGSNVTGIFERLLNDPTAAAAVGGEEEADASSKVAKFMLNTFPWIAAGVLVPNATMYVALAAIAGFYLQSAVLGGNSRGRPIWSALLTLAGVSEQGNDDQFCYTPRLHTSSLIGIAIGRFRKFIGITRPSEFPILLGLN